MPKTDQAREREDVSKSEVAANATATESVAQQNITTTDPDLDKKSKKEKKEKKGFFGGLFKKNTKESEGKSKAKDAKKNPDPVSAQSQAASPSQEPTPAPQSAPPPTKAPGAPTSPPASIAPPPPPAPSGSSPMGPPGVTAATPTLTQVEASSFPPGSDVGSIAPPPPPPPPPLPPPAPLVPPLMEFQISNTMENFVSSIGAGGDEPASFLDSILAGPQLKRVGRVFISVLFNIG